MLLEATSGARDRSNVAKTSNAKALGRTRLGRWRRRGIMLISIVLGLAIWQLADYLVQTPLLMAGPIQVVKAIPRALDAGLLHDIGVSAREFGAGIAIAAVVGILAGTAMALFVPVRLLLQPWVAALYATPIIALAPVVILWFGVGIASKIFVVAVIAIFPVIVNTESGVRQTDPDLIELARVLRLPRNRVFRVIYMRAALPSIVAGLRLAVGNGLVGVVVAELFGAQAGIGYQITVNSEVFRIDAVFLAIAVLAAAGLILTGILRMIEQRLTPWRAK